MLKKIVFIISILVSTYFGLTNLFAAEDVCPSGVLSHCKDALARACQQKQNGWHFSTTEPCNMSKSMKMCTGTCINLRTEKSTIHVRS
jgi:hypothetical protein